MLYLLWALFNLGLIIYFIVICFNATKIIRDKYGIAASIIFVIGLLSFVGNSNRDLDNNEIKSNLIKMWNFNSVDTLQDGTKLIYVDLERTLISKYRLGIHYGRSKMQQQYVPLSAYTINEGFESGTKWKTSSIVVNPSLDGQNLEYELYGTVKWCLLGVTLYTESKHWKGVVNIK